MAYGARDDAMRRRSWPIALIWPRKRSRSCACAAGSGLLALIFWLLTRLASIVFCIYFILHSLNLYFSRYSFNTGIQCVLLEALCLGVQEIQINYLKMSLTKLLLQLYPYTLIICIRDQNTGEQ